MNGSACTRPWLGRPRRVATMIALGLLACATPGGAAKATSSSPSSTADAAVFVPNYWDPKASPAKPDLPPGQRIRFLTEGDDPPFGFTLPDGTLTGFDVDLARAICETLQVTCTVQARRFETIVPALKADAGDAALASIAITPAALRDVDFTTSYYRTPARFVARTESKIAGLIPETLGAKRVAVERGTAHEAYLKAFFPNASVQNFGSFGEVRAALQSGAVDLAFGDGIALARWLAGPEGAACCAFASGPYTESRFFGEGAGIAVRKGNGSLRAALDYALARVASSGRYADIYLKYFPISAY